MGARIRRTRWRHSANLWTRPEAAPSFPDRVRITVSQCAERSRRRLVCRGIDASMVNLMRIPAHHLMRIPAQQGRITKNCFNLERKPRRSFVRGILAWMSGLYHDESMRNPQIPRVSPRYPSNEPNHDRGKRQGSQRICSLCDLGPQTHSVPKCECNICSFLE